MRLPLAASPTAVSWADAAAIPAAGNAAPARAAKASHLDCVTDRFMAISSARVHHNIDQRRLPALDHRNRALQGGPEIARIRNRAFAIDAKAPCDGCVVDVRVLDRGADFGVGDATAVTRGHALQIHGLL